MTQFRGEFRFHVTGCDSDDALEEHLDQVLDFLSEDERVVDPDYTATLKHQHVLFNLVVDAEDQAAGFALMHSALRAAIHAAEGCTRGWESTFSDAGATVSSVDSTELQDA